MAVKPPGSLSYREAAKRLGCHYETIRDLISRAVFTDLRPLGRGRGRQGFIPADEIEAFREGAEAAVYELRRVRNMATTHGR